MAVKLTPFSDFLILDPVEESRLTEMGLEIPDNATKDKPRVGKVLFIGPDVTYCEVGALVLFSPFTGERLGIQVSPVEHREYHVIREDALISLYEEYEEKAN